jgi:hypothetical protein
MRKDQLDHVLRAAGDATGQKKFVLVGSTAIVAWQAMAPPEMTISRAPDRSGEPDGARRQAAGAVGRTQKACPPQDRVRDRQGQAALVVTGV